MPIVNGQDIEADDINDVFSDAAGGIIEGIDDMKGMDNGYSILRFRKKNVTAAEQIAYFKVPEDFEIYAVGIALQLVQKTAAATTTTITNYRVVLTGATSDLQTDTPVVDHLWLGEPVTNVDGQDYIQCNLPLGTTFASSTRYVGYKLDNNRICNTLLRGSKYEVRMYTDGTAPDYTNYDVITDFIILFKPALRRN